MLFDAFSSVVSELSSEQGMQRSEPFLNKSGKKIQYRANRH